MSAVVLMRAGVAPLVLDGAFVRQMADADEVTAYPVASLAYVSDAAIRTPRRMSIDAIVSPTPSLPGLLSGQQRVDEVFDWLESARRRAITVAWPDRPDVPRMVLETIDQTDGLEDAIRLSLRLVQVDVVTPTTITVTRSPAKRSGATPRADMAPGVAEPREAGAASTLQAITRGIFGE